MIDYYGREFIDHMIDTKSREKKMYKVDYEELLEEVNKEIKQHEARVCGLR